MNRKIPIIVLIVLGVGAIAAGAVFAWKNYRGAGPAVSQSNQEVKVAGPSGTSTTGNLTSLPLSLPKGFSISLFAKDLSGARVLAFDGFGNLWVSQTKEGTISSLEIKDGKVVRQNAVFRNLNNPHGLAIDNNTMYFAEEGKVTKVALYSDDPGQKIADLPTGGGHETRTLGFGPDGRLYVSIGSSCNVCNESDERRAAVYSMEKDGSDFKKAASGLRNTVFFTWSADGRMWGTDMGRDYLGDNLPPEEINIIDRPSTSSGQNPVPDFGWPICYGQNIHDTNFDKNQYIRDPCADKTAPLVELPAHSAPLGLAFVPAQGWPQDFQGDLIVAFHGSWNRSVPTGYKLVRVKLDGQGTYQGTEDFIFGWLQGRESLGRPVDVKVGPDNALYVTDDKAGVIYRVVYGE